MFDHDIWMLAGTAATIGVVHTALGPDHYLPFVMMRRAQRWSWTKTTAVAFFCGIGHVTASFVLGALGIAFGIGVSTLENLEVIRGGLGAWLLIGFGLAYLAWGLREAWRNRPHKHWHAHEAGLVHIHDHTHRAEHAHVHQSAPVSITPWVLFVVFILGPCEALIPILMYPAYQSSLIGVGIVSAVFSVATIATMLFMVFAIDLGFSKLSLRRYERFGHALAGAAIVVCGVTVGLLSA